MLKKIFTSLYRLIWYTFAIIIISAAVLVTALRLALPGIGGYKEEIQSWVSEYMNYPVTIENINAEWQGWAPHLYLEQINLYTQNNNQLISNFDSAHIGIDLFASMTNREIVPTHLSVSGLSLDFTRNIDGSISISSDKDTNLNTNSNNETALSEWLLKQKYIIIENANLSWNDKRSAKSPIQFSGVTLELKTDNDRVQLDISLALPENHGKALYVKMDVVGNILTPNWDGTIYLEAKESKPTKLFKGFPIYSAGGTANLKFWTNWKHAKLRDFNAILEYQNFSLNTKEFELPIQSIEVNALGKRSNNKDWTIKTIVQNLKTLNHYWPTAEYQFEITKKDLEDIYKFDAHLSYINLDDAMPLIATSDVIPAGFFNGLDLDSLTGEFTDTYISIDPSTDASINFNLNTHFKDINVSTHDKQYQAEGIDGSLHINENTVSVNLDSRLSKISLKPLFDKPLSFPEIIANVELVKDEIPKVYINEMNLSNKDFNIQSSGYIQFNEQSPFIDIVAHLGNTDIEKIPAFLPKQTDPELYEWLKQALVGGELSSGDLILRGNFSDFPFKKSEGHFKSILNISNATLEYNEGWPPIDNLDVEVIFENDDLFVTSNSGHIFDAKIENITAKVNGLSKVGNDFRIYVNSSIIGHTSDAQHAILQSPLQENTALMDFANSNVTGNINVNLDLDIPLGDEKSKVNGKLSFLDTMIESDLPGLGIEGVNGYVNFTRETIWAEGLDALYHGKPVVLSIPKNVDEDEPGQFSLSGLADNEFLFNQLNSFFPSLFTTDSKIQNYVRGKSEWTLTINKEFTLDNKAIKTLELSSDLKGMAIDLPSPIGKNRDEVRSLTIKTRLKDSLIENIDIDYDNEIFGHFIIDNTQDVVIDKVLIGLGEKHSVNTQTNDISIEGNLEKLILSEWADFILPKLDVNSGDKKSPVSLDILVGNLSVFGNEFVNTKIKLANPVNGWGLSLDGKDIKGNVNINNKLNIDLEHLIIHGNEEVNEEKLAVNNLPDLEIAVDKMIYKEKDFGQTLIATSKANDGINIDKLSISKEGLTIDATGKWTQTDGIDQSEFTATLKSESIDTMLQTFGYDNANIEDGQTDIKLTAKWRDTPLNFSIEKINGELDMSIDKGQFLDIDPSAGRLFGLLSIQTLPRRLALDFTDIFNKGFSFDSIKGNFTLQQGHAYTNDLEMTGPSANIIVSGRTGLITEDYDQIATVTPKITNSLPVASALFGPIGIGVGAVIYLTGELFESIPKNIDKILSFQYSIKGSWDSPSIEKIDEEDSQSG